jgi:hypothetical protein
MAEGRGRAAGVVAVYGLGVLSWWLYQHRSPAVAGRVIVVYTACLLAGPCLIYAALRRRDGGAGRAAAFALGVPLLWLAKELYRVTGVHPPLESLYYALNPISVGVFCAALVPMALVEVARRPGPGARRLAGWPGVTLGVFAALAVGAAAVGHDNGGREIFYGYVALYRWLFAGGA